ncbi:uncharacterized protein DDB_G0290685-like isoform X1 [Sebastes umbrosus]|uniref:uncharacterized protein DDB_G0290685-like isoform X1 n=1 Tax=Sebastes umbrosus TaxID=72105 RepID=UPI00189EBAD0|nr:uncharacterized protein DDB_G0290685-like isoform X1 [Sebastes umbrosus]
MQKLCIMPDQMARLSCKSQLSSLIFHHAVAFLLLTHSHGGQSQATGQPQPIVAMVGDDITLPCHVKPATDAVHQMLEWSRPDLNPRFVHLRRFGEDQLVDQNPSYKGRTSASIDRLKQGDMSLTLSKVKLSDEGTYRCFSPGLETDSSVQLVVVPVSVTTIEITKVSSGVLQCESEGWYAEPEVLWLDGEGNLLSAGPPETVRGPDDLYNVSSRVTVEKRHSNSFTCRVQQKNINQTRETHIQVPDDFFTDSSGSNSSASTIGLVVGILFILVVAFVVWKWRQNKTKNKKHLVDEETSGGEERKSNSINNDSEQEALIERETDSREKLTVETETMKNQVKMEEENSAECLSEETGRSCQIEEETHQEKAEGEINNTPAEGETQPEETKSIHTERAAPGPAERGTQPEETKSINTETSAPGPAERGSQPEQPEQPNTERAAEGQMDGDGQQQQVRSEGKAKNDSDNRDDNAKSISEETPAPGPAERGTQPEKPNTVNIERAAEGQMDGDGKQQQQQVRTGGDANDDSDNRDDNAKSISEEIPALGPTDGGTQPEQPDTERAADDLMDGDGQQQHVMTGEEAKNDMDNKEEDNKSTSIETPGQDSTDGENNDLDQTGGQTVKIDPTLCPTEREGHTDNNRDRKDGVDNTTPLSPADGPSQKDEDEDTESTNNEPADQGSNEGDTQRDELQAGAERNTEDEKNTETERPSSPKTEQPTEEQLEKSPNSRDGEDGMTPRKGNTTSDQPPTAQAHRDVENTEEETQKTEGETHGKKRINGQPEKHLNQADINDAATSRAACGKRRQKKK